MLLKLRQAYPGMCFNIDSLVHCGLSCPSWEYQYCDQGIFSILVKYLYSTDGLLCYCDDVNQIENLSLCERFVPENMASLGNTVGKIRIYV